MKAYLVGGAVRDELLGRSVADRDWVVVGSTPEALIANGFQQIGNDFPCFLHPDTKDEYALARTERKSGKGYTGFVCDFSPEITLEEDLARRDLTINAIAKTSDGEYIDPYQGRKDLENKVLRHVSPAFVEDPLRVLRVARFAARYAHLGFRVHSSTIALMRELAEQGELRELTPERVWKELARALTEQDPSVFFSVLRECGALKILLPELDILFGIPQTPAHHPEIDTGRHVMMAVDIARELFDDSRITWAVLMHDLGKGVTPEAEWPKHIEHEKNGLPLVTDVCERLKVPKEFKTLALQVCEHHLRCHRAAEMTAKKLLKLIESLDAFRRPERLSLFVKACEADARGRLGRQDVSYPQSAFVMACAEAARNIDVQALLDQGYQGENLADQIRRQRMVRIRGVDYQAFTQ